VRARNLSIDAFIKAVDELARDVETLNKLNKKDK